jgi:hypothetical protein
MRTQEGIGVSALYGVKVAVNFPCNVESVLVKKIVAAFLRRFKSLFLYFFIFVSASFLPKVSKVKERG